MNPVYLQWNGTEEKKYNNTLKSEREGEESSEWKEKYGWIRNIK